MCSDHYLVPINLLIYAVHTLVTTIPCIMELVETDVLTTAQKLPLGSFYAPFLIMRKPCFFILSMISDVITV